MDGLGISASWEAMGYGNGPWFTGFQSYSLVSSNFHFMPFIVFRLITA